MIDFGSLLYAHKGEVVEVIDTPIGRNGAAGAGVSSLRPAGLMAGAKLSAIATVFDLLFKYAGSVSVCYCKDIETVYVEIIGASFFATKDSLLSGGTPVKQKYAAIPLLFLELLAGENNELKNLFSDICHDYEMTGLVDKTDVFKFCDSFYYGYAKNAEVTEGNVTEAEAQAAFRGNDWQIENFGMPKFFGEPKAVKPEKKAKKTKKSEKGADFLQKCKEGAFRVAYEWPEELKEFVVPVSFLDKYEATVEFEEIVRKIKFHTDKILERMDMGLTGADAIGEDVLNILLVGKPGTGKTVLINAVGAATGIPVGVTVGNKHTDEDEYEGKTKIVDGKPTFVETTSLLFQRLGGIDDNEEINLPDPSVTMGGLGQKLVYPYIVKRNGYETVVRHPLNIIFGTMNVGTNGSNPLNQALANRFSNTFILDDPTKETFINILVKASKKSRAACEWVYKAYEQTVAYLKSPEVNEEEICQNLSIRTCLGALNNMEEGQTPIRALVNSIIGAIAVVDLEVARKCQRETIEMLPEFHGELMEE